MEGNQIPAGKVSQLDFAVAVQGFQLLPQLGKILLENLSIFRVSCGQPGSNVAAHEKGILGVQPIMGVLLVMMPLLFMVFMFLQGTKQLHPGRTIHHRSGSLQGVLQKFLQPAAGEYHHIGRGNGAHLLYAEGVVVQAGYRFRHNGGDGQGRSLT